ncbi:Cas10/Cmr2 second palm domain-containing protein [Kineosporia babensis]|uniref:Death domain-containing protein n=1 Tax=Kineosporia babensis TaxID=499548 RepID=A0A9X1NNV5_9ACTN|nr:hypothetical protein [Kineosporia babensis]MCD5316909.1 hypothetical protein [Kineosporia babensis]
MPPKLHWVVLETGATQQYVFSSNRIRHIVGASQLIHDSGTAWVQEALRSGTLARPVRAVQLISGKALLLAESFEDGKRLIRSISRRALVQAPGLQVTGAISEPFDPTEAYRPGATTDFTHVQALRQVFTRQRHARANRDPHELRFRTLPWHELCRETGLPARALEPFGRRAEQSRADLGHHPANDTLLAQWSAREQPSTRHRLESLVGSQAPSIVDEITQDAWISVVHADGNGVGSLFHQFADLVLAATGQASLPLQAYEEYLARFSEELDQATRQAFSRAVAEISETAPLARARIIPIVVGGDDVTFLCHADLALPLTRAYLRHFHHQSSLGHTVKVLVETAASLPAAAQEPATAPASQKEPGGLTAAAGIAFVRRHHPFSYAYRLAEELTASAKQPVPGLQQSRSLSTYDFHIAQDSTLGALSAVRSRRRRTATSGRTVEGHCGPVTLTPEMTSDLKATTDQPRNRPEAPLFRLVEALVSGRISSARAHDLRHAWGRGVEEYQQQLQLALARCRNEGDPDITGLEALLQVQDDPGTGEAHVLLPDALMLSGITTHRRDDQEVQTR